MKKLLPVFFVLGAYSASAQTLFTYGNRSVSADEFLRAFQKNNNGGKDEKALREYLDLYIASRLKVAEAKAQHLDTLPQLKADLANLRQQILPAYLNDKESLDALVKEAFARSQKDRHVAHIYIAFSQNGTTDTVAAAAKRDEVLRQLAKGQSFADVARQYSDDPSAKDNGGDLGWITAFGLPYDLETAVYNTAEGKTSAPLTSKAGYHFFKILGERKAFGRMKAAQILLAYPPGADEAYQARVKKLADSLYNRLQAGDDFGKLATAFSNDVISAASAGNMQEFGTGDYSTAFEEAVFALPKDGAITKPFITAHGYHIVKRLSLTPVPTVLSEAVAGDLRTKIETSDRLQVTKSILAKKILKQVGYKTFLSSSKELWAYSDSALQGIKPSAKISINPATMLLKIGNRTAMVRDWMDHVQQNRYRTNGTLKAYPTLWDEFVQATALQYYEANLEDYNEDFKRQITEFADGNLFFEIMQQKVWTPAQTDTAALQNYFAQHKKSYVWKPSADAVLFYATDAAVADALHKTLQSNPSAWRTAANKYVEQVTTDSGRFELEQIPKTAKDNIKPGVLTTPQASQTDNSIAFAYVLALHPGNQPRSFTDAKGLVINDYQTGLEKAWVASLQKKYPVKVNEDVWKNLVRKAASK